jgi:hypothetical protein
MPSTVHGKIILDPDPDPDRQRAFQIFTTENSLWALSAQKREKKKKRNLIFELIVSFQIRHPRHFHVVEKKIDSKLKLTAFATAPLIRAGHDNGSAEDFCRKRSETRVDQRRRRDGWLWLDRQGSAAAAAATHCI